MCQCAERRTVIVQAAQGVSAGSLSQVAPAAAFVARTLVQDATQAVSAARMRLAAFAVRR